MRIKNLLSIFIGFISILILSCNTTSKNNPTKLKDTIQKNQKSKIMDDIETQKAGYLELINLTVGDSKKSDLSKFIDTLKNHNDSINLETTLNFVMNHLDQNGIHFIMVLDWKQEIADLVWRINSSLKDNFNSKIELPNPKKYGDNAAISAKGVFIDFDNALKIQNFRLGFIDTEADQYVITVYKINDEIAVKEAIKKIGYNCLNADSPKISPEN